MKVEVKHSITINHYQRLSDAKRFQLKHFCKQHKQSQPKQNEDVETIFQGNQLIGLVRLVPIPNQQTYWLRALYITPTARNQGYARQLMQHCLHHYSSHRIVIFALNHLEDFYHSLGFEKLSENALPEILLGKWQKSQQEGKTWLLRVSKGTLNKPTLTPP